MQLSYATQWKFGLEMFLIALLTGALAGLYPAFIMSNGKITNIFKGNLSHSGNQRIGIRRILVAVQFSISILLIVFTYSIKLQIDYIMTKELGFVKITFYMLKWMFRGLTGNMKIYATGY